MNIYLKLSVISFFSLSIFGLFFHKENNTEQFGFCPNGVYMEKERKPFFEEYILEEEVRELTSKKPPNSDLLFTSALIYLYGVHTDRNIDKAASILTELVSDKDVIASDDSSTIYEELAMIWLMCSEEPDHNRSSKLFSKAASGGSVPGKYFNFLYATEKSAPDGEYEYEYEQLAKSGFERYEPAVLEALYQSYQQIEIEHKAYIINVSRRIFNKHKIFETCEHIQFFLNKRMPYKDYESLIARKNFVSKVNGNIINQCF